MPACHRCRTSTRGWVRASRASPVPSQRRPTGGGTFVPYLAGRPSWWDRGARGQTKVGRAASVGSSGTTTATRSAEQSTIEAEGQRHIVTQPVDAAPVLVDQPVQQ